MQWKKYIALFVVSIENLKTLKCHKFLKKTLVLSFICSKCKNVDKKIFKKEEPVEILNILGLIKSILLL